MLLSSKDISDTQEIQVLEAPQAVLPLHAAAAFAASISTPERSADGEPGGLLSRPHLADFSSSRLRLLQTELTMRNIANAPSARSAPVATALVCPNTPP